MFSTRPSSRNLISLWQQPWNSALRSSVVCRLSCPTVFRLQLGPLRSSRPFATIPPILAPRLQNDHGDLSNIHAGRVIIETPPDEAYLERSLAIPVDDDYADVCARYRPFLLPESATEADWVAELELSTAMRKVDNEILHRGAPLLRILVLVGSLRSRSYSRLLAYEGARILHRLGCDVQVYDPFGLPMKDDVYHKHPKVQELRQLSMWSDGQFWVSPEQHGAVTGILKMQIDWIPLSAGSIRPTQGRTLSIAQVSGGSQSFNAVNTMRPGCVFLSFRTRALCQGPTSSLPLRVMRVEAGSPECLQVPTGISWWTVWKNWSSTPS